MEISCLAPPAKELGSTPSLDRFALPGRRFQKSTPSPFATSKPFSPRSNSRDAKPPSCGIFQPEILQRLAFLRKVGLDYLNLDRSAPTLSGGESQRIRLAAQLGSNLQGVLYVLDEPTIGLHPRDNQKLLEILRDLRDRGNSLLVVEHDEDTMRAADHIIDLGPGAGVHGGEIVAQGNWRQIDAQGKSATARLLGEPIQHPARGQRRPIDSATSWIKIQGAVARNIHGIDVSIPLHRLTALSGVSGSGKSTLAREILLPATTPLRAKRRSSLEIGPRR